MIVLPTLSIVRDELSEVRLVEDARKWMEAQDAKREPGIHASDLLNPRLAYWQRLYPEPLTERKIWLFLVGRVLHSFVLQGSEKGGDIENADDGTLNELGILFSPDKREDGFPVELKTSRAQYEPRQERLQEEFHHYFEQLCVYLVLMNCLKGSLWVLFLNLKDAKNRTFPGVRCYTVTLTDDQFAELEAQIVTIKDQLLYAEHHRNPRLLPLCRTWMCGEECTYWERCQPEGRFGRQRRQWSS